MILDSILKKLENDADLKSLLNASPTDTGIYINGTERTDSIVYKYALLSSDGIKEQSRLEISCLSKDYINGNQILDRVKIILLTIGDNQFNNDVLEIALNGGGVLFDEDADTHIIKAIFTIKNKYRRI